MRDRLRWAVRQPRAWVALGAFVTATVLTLDDGREGWTTFVATMAFWLAYLSVRFRYAADHPDAPARAAERAAAKRQRQVDEILRAYEARKAGRPPPRKPRRRDAKRQAEVDAILWRYERERAARERARERR